MGSTPKRQLFFHLAGPLTNLDATWAGANYKSLICTVLADLLQQ